MAIPLLKKFHSIEIINPLQKKVLVFFEKPEQSLKMLQ
jgi:hypothetical protein